jgi:nitrogen regulatory protein PII
MSNENQPKERKEKAFSPSRTVWRTQMAKGEFTPHRASRITCVINQLLADKVLNYLAQLGVDVFIENGRTVREHIKPRPFGLSGKTTILENTPVSIIRFAVPRECSKIVIENIILLADLSTPGRGTIFSQDLMEFSKEAPCISLTHLKEIPDIAKNEIHLLDKLSYVICVLSIPGSADNLAKIALGLGICVPLVTSGTGNDIRDQLGLIRITISPEKEVVHLIMPEQDSNNIIRLLAEEAKLDKPGRGFIYQTPVSFGLIDTRMKIGAQKYAASIEQIIAAIDTLKGGANWRKRLDNSSESNSGKSFLPQDNCEISIISEEDRIDELREACLKVGATGAVTARVVPLLSSEHNEDSSNTLIRSAVNIRAEIADSVVDKLLEISTIKNSNTDRINVLDSPAAYVRAI